MQPALVTLYASRETAYKSTLNGDNVPTVQRMSDMLMVTPQRCNHQDGFSLVQVLLIDYRQTGPMVSKLKLQH